MTVVRERWRADPLCWIHRAEARGIARELGVTVATYPALPEGNLLLRMSDPVMREVVRVLKVPYCGPGSAALERCYDKYEAHRAVTDGPATFLANEEHGLRPPFVLKPRHGSDSIGVRIVKYVPLDQRNDDHIVQERVVAEEFTVALFRDQAGMPLRILLPPGTLYSFWRKYLLRPGRVAVDDSGLRKAALRIGRLLGVDWAARVDFIVREGRAFFLECDAAPLLGSESTFAASFAAAGVDRATQLRWLLQSPNDPVFTSPARS